MGFFSNIFTKRPGPDHGPQLKAQSYDTTAIALPPIRGTLPVQGNGPNTLANLKRAAKKRSEAQLSASYANSPLGNDPRHISTSLARPGTAPSAGPNSPHLQRPKSAGRDENSLLPIVTKERKGPPYLTGITGPNNEDYAPPPVPSIASHFKRGSISIMSVSGRASSRSRSRNPRRESMQSSVFTGESRGGHVDILDVTFKSSDFKSRIKASGTRDYGEDVAERNLGINGVDLNSPAVMAFYALTGGGPLVYKSDGTAVDVYGNNYAIGTIPSNLESQTDQRDEQSARANQNLKNPRFPTRSTSLVIRGPKNEKQVSRRSSMHGANMVALKQQRRLSSPQPRVDSQTKLRPFSMQPGQYINKNTNNDDSAKRCTSPTPEACSGVDVPRSRPSTASGTPPRKRAGSNPKTRHGDDRSRSRSSRRPSSKQRREVDSDEEHQRPHRSLSAFLLNARGQHQRRHDDFDTESIGTAASGDYTPSRVSGRAHSSNSHYERPPSQRSHRKGQVRAIDPYHQSSQRGGSRSIAPSNLDDICEDIVNRRPSLSISSSTPSSALSGFIRPHTASTSVDLAPTKENRQPKFHPNELQDYSTTDDESLPRPRDDEGLLFNEGFGGLPGLFDSHIPAVPTWLNMTPHTIHSYPRKTVSTSHLTMSSLPKWDDFDSSSMAETTSILSTVNTFDSEMDDKLDVKLAVRLRKEMKRRERTAVRSKTLQRKSGLKQGPSVRVGSDA